MAASSVTGLVPGGLARQAAYEAGLPAGTNVSALVRAAVVMFVTGDRDKALAAIHGEKTTRTVGSLSRDESYFLAGHVGEEMHNQLRNVPNKSDALRAGLAMLAGWTKEDAEDTRFVAPAHRPKKSQ